MDDALAVISASTDNIEIMHEVLKQQAVAAGSSVNDLLPEQWLSEFYAQRKGSGKKSAARSTLNNARAMGA
jgi:type IV secretion system protein VirB4